MRRWLGVGLGVFLLAGWASGSAASASPPSSADPFASVPDGYVSAIATTGGATYLAGGFDGVGQPVGSAAAFDPATGAHKLLPQIAGGTVRAAVPDGSGGWYIGGDFDRVAGAVRYGLAHVKVDGSVDPAFPQIGHHPLSVNGLNEDVESLALSANGATLYVGGFYEQIGGQTRNSLAAIDTASGGVTAWNPQLSAQAGVERIVVGYGGSLGSVFIGGEFNKVGAVTVDQLARVSVSTGLADAAFKPEPMRNGGLGGVSSIALNSTGDALYAGGRFDHIGGQARAFLGRVSVSTGVADAWNPDPDSEVHTILVGPLGATVYVGGTFTSVGTEPRNGLAAISPTTAAATSWAPQLPLTSQVNAMAFSGADILAVGRFTSVSGVPRAGFVLLDAGTGGVQSFNPPLRGSFATAATGAGAVLLGGSYLALGAFARSGIAAVNPYGRLTTFAPQITGVVHALALSADGHTLYIGGRFTAVNGQPRTSLAAFDTATGALRPWTSAITDVSPHGNVVRALAVSRDGGTLYVGGSFDHLGSDLQPRSNLGGVSTTTGKADGWTAGVTSAGGAGVDAIALSPDGGTVYVGGFFTSAGHNGQPRLSLAALSAAAPGDATAWAPDPSAPGGAEINGLSVAPNGTVYVVGNFTSAGHNAQPRTDLAAITPAAPGDATAWNPAISTVDPTNAVAATAIAVSEAGRSVFVAGQFDHLGGQPRTNLGEVDVTLGAATAWNPDPGQYYDGIGVIEAARGAVRIGGSFERVGNDGFAGYAQFTAGPVALTGPTIGGKAAYGRKLTCSAGSFANSPFAFVFGWVRDGKLIAGQTGQTYIVRGVDSGHLLACAVVGANARGSASAQSGTVRPGPYILSFTRRTVHGGFRLSFRLTERARVSILLQRQRGRRRVRVRTLHANAHTGLNRLTIKRRSLVIGAHYILTISARDSHKLNANVRRLKITVPPARRRRR